MARWLQGLPPEAITADPPVAFVAAWIGGFSGASKQQTDRWLAAVEDQAWEGGLPEGINSLAFGAALTRAVLVFDDVGHALWSARRALELAGPQPSPFHWMAQAALGQARYLSGQTAEMRAPLEALVQRVSPIDQPYAVVNSLALLALLAGDQDDNQTGAVLAARAAETAEVQGLSAEPLSGIVHLALGRALLRQGKLAEAEERLEWALELFGIDAMAVHRAHGLLLLAAVRHAAGDPPGAAALLEATRELVQQLTDPGELPALVGQASGRSAQRPAAGSRSLHPSPSESSRSCGCSRPSCPPARSAGSCRSRSPPSAARSRPSTASSRSTAGPRRSPRPISSACSHRHDRQAPADLPPRLTTKSEDSASLTSPEGSVRSCTTHQTVQRPRPHCMLAHRPIHGPSRQWLGFGRQRVGCCGELPELDQL